jgi:ribosomal protein S6--L-glutamate ligase
MVVGDKVVVAMERSGKKDFRANISQDGSGRLAELTKEQEQICVTASKALGLSFSGVDLMKDANGKIYIIEVNGNPGTKIIDITGHNYFDDLVAFIETQTGNPAAEEKENSGIGNPTEPEEESKDPNKFALRQWKKRHPYS